MTKNIPVNKGNYSLETPEREQEFERKRGFGVEKEFKENRRQWYEYPKNQYLNDYPLHIDLELSTACNLKCPFCFTHLEKYAVEKQFMKTELFKKIIDEIAGKVYSIRLSHNGEPTLHPDFFEVVRYAKEKGVKEVATLTNGSKMTPEFFEKTMNAGMDWITLSFDGLYEEYEKNRYPLKFDEMYKRLQQIKEIKEKNNKVKPVLKLQSLWPAIEKNPEQYYEKMSPVCDLLAFNPLIDFTEEEPPEGFDYEENFSCPQLYQRLIVNSDGTVSSCTGGFGDTRLVGDANKETIYDIWHGEKENRLRKLHKQKDGFKQLDMCKKCFYPRKTYESRYKFFDKEVIVNNYSKPEKVK